MTTLRQLTPLLLLPALLLDAQAKAEPPGTAGTGQIGGLLAGGVGLNDNGVGAAPGGGGGGGAAPPFDVGNVTGNRYNPYGFGFGPRGGYTFEKVPVYLGAVFVFFVGEREVVDAFGISAKARSGYFLLAAEGGYDIGVGPVVIRPSLWLGPAILRTKACTSGLEAAGVTDECNGDSDTSVVIGPGASVIYAFKKIPLWVGGELRFTIVPGEIVDNGPNHVTSLMFGAQVGMLLGR